MKKTNIPSIIRRAGFASSLVFAALALPAAGYSATINQTVTNPSSSGQPSWNSAIWGAGPAAPTAGNDYVTANGGFSASQTFVGTTVTGRAREDGETFLGDSLTVSADTEVLFKQQAGETSSANIFLDGGVLRYAPNNAATLNGTLAGTIDVTSESYLGISQTTDGTTFDVNSTLTGSGLLHLAAGSSSGTLPALNLVLGGDLSGYTGTFDIGGGGNGNANNDTLTLSFGQAYTLPSLSVLMGDHGTPDILDLNYDLTVGSFAFNGSSLATGTYAVSDLNTQFGTGSQFAGTGSLTVVPEPGSIALASLAGGMLLLFRRRQKR